jgi:hypothetical protein
MGQLRMVQSGIKKDGVASLSLLQETDAAGRISKV